MVTSDDKMYKTLKQELLSQKDRQGIPSAPLRQFIRYRPTAKFPLRHRYFYRFTVISKRYFLQSRIHAGIRHCKDGLSCHRLYHYGTRFRSCKRHTAGLQAIVARIEHRLQQFFCLPTALLVPKSHSSVHGKATGRTECPFPYTRYNRTYHPRALVRGQSTNGEFSRYPADSSYRHLFCCAAPSSQDAFRRLRTLSRLYSGRTR